MSFTSYKKIVACLVTIFAVGIAFTPFHVLPRSNYASGIKNGLHMAISSSTASTNTTDDWFLRWATENGIDLNTKLKIREPLEVERGKGGVFANEDISALEVVARIPRPLIVTALDAPLRAIEAAAQASNFSWAADLTAATLVALHPTTDEISSKQAWIRSWEAGGWATDGADLGPPDANFGSKAVTGSLLATGSDNDHNIYAKFRMPCHPVLFRASRGLEVLTGCSEDDAREALTCRGRYYRSMRDALQELVLTPSVREKGSNRERRSWDVADTLSRVLSRVTMVELEDSNDKLVETHAIVPLYERLAHCVLEKANSKLVASEEEVLVVATRDIKAGEAITRDYTSAPRLDQDVSEGPLRLLLQFGLPPSAW